MAVNEAEFGRQRWRNLAQVAVMLLLMVGLLVGVGWLLAGQVGAVAAGVGVGLTLLFRGSVSPTMVMRFYRGRPLQPMEHPRLYELARWLAQRAGLDRVPTLFAVPAAAPTALSVGGPRDGVIAVSLGLLEHFSERELRVVMAHEMAHLAGRDNMVLGLAETLGRMTGAMAQIGLFLALLNLPLLLAGYATISWSALSVLVLSPSVAVIMQLALSRNREFQADLMAARLSGDPRALASALWKVERMQRGMLRMLLGRRADQVPQPPPLLQTHPSTEKRVKRLRELEDQESFDDGDGWPWNRQQQAWRVGPRFPRYHGEPISHGSSVMGPRSIVINRR